MILLQHLYKLSCSASDIRDPQLYLLLHHYKETIPNKAYEGAIDESSPRNGLDQAQPHLSILRVGWLDSHCFEVMSYISLNIVTHKFSGQMHVEPGVR